MRNGSFATIASAMSDEATPQIGFEARSGVEYRSSAFLARSFMVIADIGLRDQRSGAP